MFQARGTLARIKAREIKINFVRRKMKVSLADAWQAYADRAFCEQSFTAILTCASGESMPRGVEHRDRIKQAALELFVAKGVLGTSVRDIAAVGGDCRRRSLSPLRLQGRSRLEAVFGKLRQRLPRNCRDLAKAKGGFASRLGAMIGRFCRFFDQEPLMFRFLLLTQHQELPKLRAKSGSPVQVLHKLVTEAQQERRDLQSRISTLATAQILGLILQPATFIVYGLLAPGMERIHADTVAACLKVVFRLGASHRRPRRMRAAAAKRGRGCAEPRPRGTTVGESRGAAVDQPRPQLLRAHHPDALPQRGRDAGGLRSQGNGISWSSHGVAGEVLIADNGSTDGSQDLARAAGARVVDIPVKGLRCRAHRRHRCRRRPLHHHGRFRRQLRFCQSDGLCRTPAGGFRGGDGQPLPGRYQARRHAAFAPLFRQPGPDRHRQDAVQESAGRFSLRPARLFARRHPFSSICARQAWNSPAR